MYSSYYYLKCLWAELRTCIWSTVLIKRKLGESLYEGGGGDKLVGEGRGTFMGKFRWGKILTVKT